MSSFPTLFRFTDASTLTITSDVGYRKSFKRMHKGLDIGLSVGTPLYAPIGGMLRVSREVGIKDGKQVPKGWGLNITITTKNADGNSITVRFAHLSWSQWTIGTSINVKPGVLIAKSGGAPGYLNSGSSQGPHLHLEVLINNSFVDPKPFLSQYTLMKGGKVLQQSNPTKWGVNDNEIYYLNSEKITSKGEQVMTKLEVQHSDVEQKPIKKETEFTSNERYAPGIWQIVKVLIDSSVQQKQIVNSSIATQTGSLMNFVNRVCQKPLVEFFGDTYGSQYYFFVRRPPFDKEGFLRMINNGGMVIINSKDVISTNLAWNNQNIYSWYQYRPYADFLGSEITGLFFPSLFFPQYASIWGSKPLVIDSNYYNYAKTGRFNSTGESNKVKDVTAAEQKRIIQNAVMDFKYVIESNAYNPFYRQGTITLKGNRQLKRGTACYYAPTNEVFYIDSVTQDWNITTSSVSRNTSISVSRGLVMDYIYDNIQKTAVTQKEVYLSYFNIIDFSGGNGKTFEENIKNVDAENFTDFLKTWRVRADVFDFFISKNQFMK